MPSRFNIKPAAAPMPCHIGFDQKHATTEPRILFSCAFTKGILANASVGVFNQTFGGDSNFERLDLLFLGYVPLTSTLTLGMRVEGDFSFGDAPFYTLPFINLRGAAIRRYVGEHMADTEVEIRWQFWKRFSLVGCGRVGVAWNDFEQFASEQTVATGGVEFRYELARKYGLHAGLDVAFGPDDTAIYIQFGSAWFRP